MGNVKNTLSMKFRTQDDKTRVVTLSECRMNATEAEIKALMDAMIAGGAFVYAPAEKLGADLVQTVRTKVF